MNNLRNNMDALSVEHSLKLNFDPIIKQNFPLLANRMQIPHLSGKVTYVNQNLITCASNIVNAALREYQAGHFEQTENLCTQWLNEHGESVERCIILASIYIRQRKYEKACPYADKAMKMNGSLVEPYIFMGIINKERGNLGTALDNFCIALYIQPNNIDAHIGIANCYLSLNDYENAIKYCMCGLQKNPDSILCRHELGNMFKLAGKFDEARKCYEKVLEQKIDYGPAWLNLGYIYTSTGLAWLGMHHFEKAIHYDPFIIDSYLAYGNMLRELKLYDRATQIFIKALSIFPSNPLLHGSLAGAYQELGYIDLAIDTYKHAIGIHSNYPDAYCNLANALKEKGDITEAEKYYGVAISLCPTHADSFNNLANIYRELGKIDECIELYKKAIEICPTFAAAHSNIATVYQQIGNLPDAITYYQKAISANPNSPDSHCFLGNAFKEVGNMKSAVDCYARALQLSPCSPDIYAYLASTYKDMGNVMEAIQTFKISLKFRPTFPEVFCNLAHCFQLICNWDDYENRIQKLVSIVVEQLNTNKPPSVHPHHSMLYPLTPEQRKSIASKHALFCLDRVNFIGFKRQYTYPTKIEKGFKLKVGYVSSDFSNHPTSHLIQSVPGLHDKSRFEVYCYSLIANDGSSFRKKISQEVDHFHDISSISSVAEIADMINKDGIHILLNLNGYTKGARNEIFALQPAPVQAMYLGYPGTSGATYMDYIITDKISSPIEHEEHYSEYFAYMPNSFFIGDHANMFPHVLHDLTKEKFILSLVNSYENFFNNDTAPTGEITSLEQINSVKSLENYINYHILKRNQEVTDCKNVGERIPECRDSWLIERATIGIPSGAFVYCNFNQLYKLDPSTFESWCRILKRVPNSVLWLLRFPKAGEANIRGYANEYGIAQERIIFSEVTTKEDHVRRGQLADVCLDTPLCNGHTTGMDVLWAGCPIVTMPLDTFASRVGSSIVSAIGCKELIVKTIQEYEDVAVKIGTDENFYKKVKKKVWYQRLSSSLFNVRKYVHDLDDLLWKIWNKYEKNRQKGHILV